jgi:hypothetical protein
VGYNGTVFTSPDGIRWTYRSSGTTNHLLNIALVNDMFMIVGNTGTIITSSDGFLLGQNHQVDQHHKLLKKIFMHTICLWLAVGYYGTISTNLDGSIWINRTSNLFVTKENLFDVTYGNGMFVDVATNGIILYSPDGFT